MNDIPMGIDPYFLIGVLILLILVLTALIVRLRNSHARYENTLHAQATSIRESEENYRRLVKNAPVCVHEIDLNGRFTSMNDAGLAMLGVEEEYEVCGLRYLDAACEEDQPRIKKLMEEAFKGEASFFQFKSKQVGDASPRYFDSSFIPIKDNNGDVIKLMGVTQDFTHRVNTEKELRASEAKFRDLADLLPMTIYECDANARFTYTNKMGLKLFGYSAEDLERGVNIAQLIDPIEVERAMADLSTVVRGGKVESNRYSAIKKDGRTFPALVYAQRIMMAEKVVGLRGAVVDLTEREKMEEELRKNQNLESLGVLAGGIAHDFNNVLTGVIGNLEVLETVIDPASEAGALVLAARNASDRTRSLSHQLLTFAKGGVLDRNVIHLESLLRETVDLSLRGSNCKARIEIDANLSNVNVDEGQISQVVQNLVINADQSMTKGGVIVVKAENVSIDDPDSVLRAGKYVQLTVADSGAGIKPDVLSKIFDPYFTSKSTGHGLGLSISLSIVRKHGGDITVVSEPGIGSTFQVLLPVSAQPEQTNHKSEPGTLAGDIRILLMDDEKVVRDTIRKMLMAIGARVECTEDGAEAIKAYGKALEGSEGFDLVIVDLTVPAGMGGLETLKQILAINPDARVIVSSGYSDDPVMRDYKAHGFIDVLPKPISLSDLQSVVGRQIARA